VQIAVNARVWPDEALFTPAQFLEATQRFIGRLSPETFVLYEADIEEGKAAHGMWPKGVVALVSTTYHGYLPYTHGLQSFSNASAAGLALARFAALALAVGDPAHVRVVQSGDDLMDLVDSADPPRPILVLFSSFTSAQTARMRPFFEAAAGLYERQIPFADVRCAGKGSNTALAALCRRHNITAYPTLGLFTVRRVVPARAAAGFAHNPCRQVLVLPKRLTPFVAPQPCTTFCLPVSCALARALACAGRRVDPV
jgi:hypothetical protein